MLRRPGPVRRRPARIAVTLTTLDPRLSRLWEPGAATSESGSRWSRRPAGWDRNGHHVGAALAAALRRRGGVRRHAPAGGRPGGQRHLGGRLESAAPGLARRGRLAPPASFPTSCRVIASCCSIRRRGRTISRNSASASIASPPAVACRPRYRLLAPFQLHDFPVFLRSLAFLSTPRVGDDGESSRPSLGNNGGSVRTDDLGCLRLTGAEVLGIVYLGSPPGVLGGVQVLPQTSVGSLSNFGRESGQTNELA